MPISSWRLGLMEIYRWLIFKGCFQYESGVDLTGQVGNDINGGAESSGQLLAKGWPSFISGKKHGDKIFPAYGVDASVFSIVIVYQLNQGFWK